MQLRRLGRSGLVVSEFALGAMTFGMKDWGCDEQTAIDLVDRYLDAGGNFLDTADAYGSSEEIVGRAIKGKRSQVVLGTKAGLPTGRGPHDRGTSRLHLVSACERSLRRLGTDYIDVYWLHLDDEATPLEETVSALDDLVHAGKIRYVAASNMRAYRLMKALAIADRIGAQRFVAFQGQYNLITRTLEREHFGLLSEEGLGFVGWSPLAAGMLTGKVTPDAGNAGTRLGQREVTVDKLVKNERGFRITAEVRAIATELGCSPARLALSWQRTRPITSTILGARTPEQLDDNLSALGLDLPVEIVERLDRLSEMPAEYPGAFIDMFQGWLRGDITSMSAGSHLA
ncbi:aldo/keto reductase [Rhodococcus sp. SJ-3]|uniref:aldo/keto reductase n=1 Tax=Rhodococcus sp. SJ-3 TaxID=3454628 RepID=UPI003F793346